MGSLISPDYLQFQKELHAKGNYGISSGKWAHIIGNIAQREQCADILDYGCGTGQLKAALGNVVREYDPCIAGKDADPAPADMVVCTDVLEHIEPDKLDGVLAHLKSKTKKTLFFTIALRPAGKVLSDGRNAHLIVESSDWWRERLSKYFSIAEWNPREGKEVAGLARPTAGLSFIRKPRKLTRNQRRQWNKFFDDLRAGSKRYSDEFSAIDTFSFWEYDPQIDKMADCQVVVNILEHVLDVDAALENVKELSRRATLFGIQLDTRNLEYWKEKIGKYFGITETHQEGDRIIVVANPMTLVPGVKVIAAGASDGLVWENILASNGRYSDHVQGSPPHDRRAIIVCYGPSLTKSWHTIPKELEEGPADIFTVSGAHDFMISQGIVQRYHVECDPRPHKADNIRCESVKHLGIEYLLASSCHPKLFAKFEGCKIRLWHSVGGRDAVRIRDELRSTAPFVFGGGSVGLRSIGLVYYMGYRKISIYGMDCSYSDDGSEKWAGPHAQKANPKEQHVWRVKYNGRLFTTSPVLLTYGANFFDMVKRLPGVNYRMFGDGLLQARVAGPPTPIEVQSPQEQAA